tara:strand:- start:266 stop:1066 length:801 start_codon:yes stop_codon:yes gene_type:complete
MNLEIFKDFAIETAKSSGEILMTYFNSKYAIKKKSSVDLVTKADIESENNIIDSIKKNFPEHGIIAEESNLINHNSEFKWIIDPLDGTTNFVHSLPIFAISIALQYKNQTVLGVVYNPAYNKCFWAIKNHGAYENKTKISVSKTDNLIDSLLVTGFPYNHNKSWDKSFELFHEFYSKTQGIRRLGAASLDFCFVAMGRFEGFYEFNLKPWDVCAGDLICREAGGKTSDWAGNEMPFSGSNIIASNNFIHKKILEVINQKKYDIILN